jgi:hypothetical protein
MLNIKWEWIIITQSTEEKDLGIIILDEKFCGLSDDNPLPFDI